MYERWLPVISGLRPPYRRVEPAFPSFGAPGYPRIMRRRPPRRALQPRLSDNEKRDLSPTIPSIEERDALSARATYAGYAKHKRDPYAWGLEPFAGYAPDRSFCEDVGFRMVDAARTVDLLRRGITAGLFGDLYRHDEPTMLWTVDDNGWIYELRHTVPGRAIYHGYPLIPTNALGRKVIARFEAWLFSIPRRQRSAILVDALRAAQERYR